MSVTATTTQQLKRGTARFWIVLVGVNRYLDSNILNLRYCANDCKELAEALEIATGEFQHAEIISLYDGGNLSPERSQIINSIQQFRWAKPEDTVLFYFSGHGYLDSNNRPVLCVADTRLDNLAETGLKLDFLLNELSQCRAQRQLVWLDACQEREQQPDNQIKQNPTQQLSAALKEQAEKSQNFHAMLSCDKQERSWEIEELQHGLFTFCLIEGLRGKAANSKGQIDADGLFNYVERITSRIIEDRKNPGAETLSKGMMINVQQIKQSSPPPKTKRLPANASQTPKRIVQGGGELVFLIGLAAPINNRKALICDRLSNSEADIKLCKLLQAQGNFAVEYFYLRDKQQWQLQQDIIRYLANENRTVLLYLSGTIESTADRGYELVCDSQHRINLNWLAKELKASPVREIVLIANIAKATETTPSLESILQLNYDLPLCLIEATSRSGDRQFLARLVTTLSTAAKAEKEFWVTDLFSPLQKWSLEQLDIEVTGWWGTVGLIEILSVKVQRSYNRVFDIEVCPYKSLEAFTQDDAYFFHGREELITKIIEKLKSNSFLAVVGASGSGKSSVVRAGVIPKLIANGLNTTSSQQVQACQTWVMLPGDSPFTAMAKAIAPNEPELIEGVLHAGIKGFVDWLRQQPQAIYVLAIDQFEELFTLTAEKERIDFIKLIIAAVERAGDCFKVIITLRGDFINECLNLSEIAPLMEQNEILVPVKSSRLEDEQYRQIIAQPAQKVGLEVEDGLMAVLLEELKDGSLPLLQYALEELWQKRREGKLTLKDYQQHIGRLGQFLSDKAEATYQNLNQLQQECAQSIFLSLVYLAQEQDKTNKDTRRRLLKSDLRVNKYKDTLDDTLQTLVDARLIVVSGEESDRSLVTDGDRQNALAVADEVKENNSDRDKDTVEIAHEILIDNWKTLKWWLDNNRDKYRLIREINHKARDWKQNNQQEGFLLSKGALAKYEEFYIKYANELSKLSDRFMDASIQARDKADRLAKRRQRQIIGGLTGGIVAISMVAGAALWQLRRATINEVEALINSTEASLISNQGIDSLILGLKTGKKINESTLGVGYETKVKFLGSMGNIFHQVRESNRIEDVSSASKLFFSLDGKHLITTTTGEYSNISIWSETGKILHTFKGNVEDNMVFNIDDTTFASTNKFGLIEIRKKSGKILYRLKGHSDKIKNITISQNGKYLASASEDKTIKLWSEKGKLLHTFKDIAENIVLSPDGNFLASTDNEIVKIWDRRGKLLRIFKQRYSDYFHLIFSPDSKYFASNNGSGEINLWNIKENSVNTIDAHLSDIKSITFSPDSRYLVSTGVGDYTANIWRVRFPKQVPTKLNHLDDVNHAIFSPNSEIVATASDDGLIKLWSNSELIQTLQGHLDEKVYTMAFSPDGKRIASASDIGFANNMIRLWDIEDTLGHTLQKQSYTISSLFFNSDSKTIIAGSNSRLKIWNYKGELLEDFGQPSDVNILAYSSINDLIVSGHENGTIRLFNAKRKLLHTLESHTDEVNKLVFSPDGKTIASAGYDNTIKLWNIRGEILHTLEGHSNWILDIEFSPDGKTIVSASRDNTIKIWNLKGQLIHTLKGHANEVHSAKFAANGKIIASAGYDNIINLWNLKGQLTKTIKDHKDSIFAIAISPKGNSIASASGDKTIKLWNTKGKLLKTLKGHSGSIYEIAFSPNGKIIASGDSDGQIIIWNNKGKFLNSLKGHANSIDKIVFSPNSKIIASVENSSFSNDSSDIVKLWSLDLDGVMSRGCDWVRDYLENNPNVSEEDRKICDGY